jgi:pimeloyl-ACP methyl ester carboxylesterase
MKRKSLVLVPGLDGTALLFYRQVPLLSDRFDVSTFPLPDDSECTMETLVRDLAEHVDGLPGPVILCGESFGGALSLSFALAHPEKVRGLVIVNSFPRIRQRVRIRLGPPLLKLVPWGAMSLVRRFTESKLHTSHTSAEDLREFHERAKAIGREGYIRRLEILKDFDVRKRLHEIETPTLLLAADRDRLVPALREARFMVKRMPQATIRILEGYGHICMINHDFSLLDYVDPWLASIA